MGRVRLVVATLAVCVVSARGSVAQNVPTGTEGWVVLPIDEYRVLRERAIPREAPPAAPPVEATLTRVDYDLRLDGDTIAGRAQLTIDVLRQGWTRVQVPPGLMVRDARIDGQPLPLVEGPPPHVLLSRPGRSIVTLDIALPLATAAGSESIALPASPSPISRVTLTLPRTGVELSLTGGFVSERTESPRDTRWVAFGSPNQPLSLSWKRRVDDRRADVPVRVRARVTELVSLGEESSALTASVRAEVVQGLAREVTAALPAGLVVNHVNGATVADWDVTDGHLRVRLLEPSATEVSFVVTGEVRTPREGAIPIPIVRVPSAEREVGGVAVDVAGAGQIDGRQSRGFEPADPSELGEFVSARQSPSMVAFRRRPAAGTETRALTVTVVRYTPQPVLVANVEEARYRALASEDGRLLVHARYAVRNNQRSFLKVTMPAGSTVWSAEVAGRPTRPGLADAGAVLLPLEKGRAGEQAPTFVVELMYLQRIDDWLAAERARIDLPALDLPVSRTSLALHHSPRLRLAVGPGAFRLDTDPGPFADVLRPPSESIAKPAPPATGGATGGGTPQSALQTLVERFRAEPGGRTVAGTLPVDISFPAFGPAIFLASELTAEGSAPSIELTLKRARS